MANGAAVEVISGLWPETESADSASPSEEDPQNRSGSHLHAGDLSKREEKDHYISFSYTYKK